MNLMGRMPFILLLDNDDIINGGSNAQRKEALSEIQNLNQEVLNEIAKIKNEFIKFDKKNNVIRTLATENEYTIKYNLQNLLFGKSVQRPQYKRVNTWIKK
jgi:hypothetical protein